MQKYNVSIWIVTAVAVATGAFVMAFVVNTIITFFGGGFIEYCAFIVGFFLQGCLQRLWWRTYCSHC